MPNTIRVDLEAEDPAGVPALMVSMVFPLLVLSLVPCSQVNCGVRLVVPQRHDLGVGEHLDSLPRSKMH